MRRVRPAGVLACLFTLTLTGLAQGKATHKKSETGTAVDKAYLQKIWDGWAT